MDDIFEKIIAHKIPAEIVYEDEHIIAFLDIKPINHGHVLVVPKIKFQNIFDAPMGALHAMIEVAQKIAVAQKNALGVSGVNIIMNNGAVAGQEIFHAHIHVIPRFEEDGFYKTPEHTDYKEGEMSEIGATLRNGIV